MRTRTWFGAILGSIAVSLLLVSPMAMADKGVGAFKLEGAWIAKVDGLPGQWSYVLVADPSGRRASGHGSVDVGFVPNLLGCSAFGPTDFASPILVDIVMISPDKAVYNSVYYGLRRLDPSTSGGFTSAIVYIGVVKGELKVVGPGKLEGTHYFEFYDPTQDADPVDGLPDMNEIPTCTAPMAVHTMDTRLPSP
jgi:hypothetical protein